MTQTIPALPNPKVSVVLPRSEWLFLELFLAVHALAFDETLPNTCPHMHLPQVRKRLEKIEGAIIKSEQKALP